MRSGLSLLRALRQGLPGASSKQTLPALVSSVSTAATATEETSSRKHTFATLGGIVAGIVGSACVASASGEASDGMHAPHYPWSHEGIFDAYDHGAIRRGHQVYQQVCAACHSMQYLHWRQLVGVAYTEEEAKALAAECEVVDGPNDEGEMYTRPGRLSDKLPIPYANEQAARYANGGAYPPDLTLMTGARHDGQNYMFALLTGYREPPAGISVRQGLYYNPYFPGGAIAMPRMLVDGGVEYFDGTPSSTSQQAKDVTTFLTWSCYPFQDEMRVMGLKACLVVGIMMAFSIYSKRLRWGPLKSQKVVMNVVN